MRREEINDAIDELIEELSFLELFTTIQYDAEVHRRFVQKYNKVAKMIEASKQITDIDRSIFFSKLEVELQQSSIFLNL